MKARSAIASAQGVVPRLPPIYADFVEASRFNAFAFRSRDRYGIAFHDGLPVVLALVINRFLANPRLFTNIGLPEAEDPKLPHMPKIVSDAARLAAVNPRFIQPNDPPRIAYAIHLCDLAFDFLTAHEIAHIVNGHVDYRRLEYGRPYVDESEWMPGTTGGNLESQAMELDADATAAYMMVVTSKFWVANRTQLAPESASLYQSAEAAMVDVATAICIVFRLFQDTRMDGVDLFGKSHPPTRWRQIQILNMMGNYVSQLWDASLFEAISHSFSDVIARVEEAFEITSGSPQQILGLHDAWLGEGWKYATKLTRCWNDELRPKVAKYAYSEPSIYHFDVPPQDD